MMRKLSPQYITSVVYQIDKTRQDRQDKTKPPPDPQPPPHTDTDHTLRKGSTPSVGVSTSWYEGTPSALRLSKKFWHSAIRMAHSARALPAYLLGPAVTPTGSRGLLLFLSLSLLLSLSSFSRTPSSSPPDVRRRDDDCCSESWAGRGSSGG